MDDGRAPTVSGKRLVLVLLVLVLGALAAYPFVRRYVTAAQARERAAERARDEARTAGREMPARPR